MTTIHTRQLQQYTQSILKYNKEKRGKQHLSSSSSSLLCRLFLSSVTLMTGLMKAQCAVCVKCRYRVLLKHYTLCGSDVTMLGAGTLTLSYIRADCHLYGSWHCEQTATLLVVVEETLWSVYRVGKWKAVSTVNLCFMCVLTAGRQCLFGRPVTKGKGKVNPVQALSLCTGRTPYRGSRGIALLFLDHGTIRG